MKGYNMPKIKKEIQEINIPGIRKLKGGETIPDNILKKLKELKLNDIIEGDNKIEKNPFAEKKEIK
jgi:hypothetical protein